MSKGDRGFLLIEALLATVVLSVGVMALVSAIRTVLRSTALAGSRYRAASLLEGRVLQIQSGRPPGDNVENGRDELLGPISYAAFPAPDSPSAADHRRLPGWRCWNVSISWKVRNGEESLSLPVLLPRQ